jgi:hypothetical protein
MDRGATITLDCVLMELQWHFLFFAKHESLYDSRGNRALKLQTRINLLSALYTKKLFLKNELHHAYFR